MVEAENGQSFSRLVLPKDDLGTFERRKTLRFLGKQNGWDVDLILAGDPIKGDLNTEPVKFSIPVVKAIP